MKLTFKRYLALILALLMIFAVSCSDKKTPAPDDNTGNDTSDNQNGDVSGDIGGDGTENDGENSNDQENGGDAEVSFISRDVEERYFIYRIWNFNITSLKTFKSTVDAAKETGFNCIKIHIPWLHVQDLPNKYNFDAFDPMVEYVVSKGMKVAISVDMTRRASNTALISEEHLQRDAAGNICQGGVYFDKSVISFSSEYAVDMAVKFYKKTVEHYEKMYSDSILFYLPAFTPYCETEYWCVGEYDYSPQAQEAFREFLKEKYETVDKLNKATGESFASFEAVTPPSCSRVDNFGMLWYQFRHAQLKNVIDELAAAQKSIAPDSKITIQLGSVFDSAGNLRGTIGFEDLCENVDVIWLDDGPAYNHKFSMDYVRSVLPAHVEIAQEIDGPTQVNASKENYLDQGLTSFERDATYLSIANWSIDQNYRNYENVWKQIISTWLLDDPPETLKVTDESPVLEIPLSSFFKNGSINGYISRYSQLAPNGEAVYVKVIDDLTSREIIDYNAQDENLVSGKLPFNKEQGKDGWYYMSHQNGKFTPMTYDEANERWQGDSEFALIMGNSVHPDTCDVAILYETQKAGELTFSVELQAVSGQSNGITYAVYVNGKKQTDKGLSGTLYPNELLTIEKSFLLKKGDTIAIVVGNNGQSSFDTTAISVNVAY